jgi:hypothetical protein
MEDDFKDYDEYYFLRQYPDAPDQAELAQSMEAMQTTEPSESMDGMQLAAGPSPDKINMAMQNMPLETSSETTMRRMVEDQQAGITGQIIPQDRTLRQNLVSRTQQALIDNLGIDNYKARKLAETIFGGESSNLPLGIGLTDFTPAAIPMAFQESGISAGQALESAGRGEYGTAAAQYGMGVLQGAEAIPGVKLATKAAKKIGSAVAPQVGEAFEKYAETTGLTSYIVQPKRSLGTLVKKLESGTMDEQSYIEGTKLLNDALQKRPGKVTPDDLVRGKDHVTSRLLASLSPTAQVQLQEPTVRFAEWLLYNNPHLANELGISIIGKSGKGYQAGKYTTDTGDNLIDRVATIFANGANKTTAVHEILHHTEQMMPIEVQNGVTDAWTKSYLKAYREATPEVKEYLKLVPEVINGRPGAKNKLIEGFANGTLNYADHYQFVNPSEYWAVNATRLMQSRYEAGSWIGKAKVWLGEFTEKAKGAFGLQSDAPVLKGLQSVIKGTGELQTGMLVRKSNISESVSRVREQKVKRKKTISNIEKGAAVTATGAALTGDEGQK